VPHGYKTYAALYLGLGPEDLSPALVRKVVRQGGKDSFPEASAELKEHHDLELQAKQVQRITEGCITDLTVPGYEEAAPGTRFGAAFYGATPLGERCNFGDAPITERVGQEWVGWRDQEVEMFKKGQLPRGYAKAPEVAAVMVDGGRLLTRAADQPPGVHQPQWRGPRFACCLSLQSFSQAQDPQPEPPAKFLGRERARKLVLEVQSRAGGPLGRTPPAPAAPPAKAKKKRPPLTKRRVQRLVRTVVATMAGAEEFGYIVAAEVHRRGLDLAARKGYVCDGELANWTIFEEHFRAQGFVPILDFLHLLAHLYAAAQAAGGGPARQWARYLDWLRWAWGGQREKLWAALCAAASRAGAPPKGVGDQDPRLILAQTVQYVEHNLERMDYPRYRKLGLPISSAPVESAIKQFNRRMKGTEKFWTPAGAEAVLQVRAAYLSEDGRAERYWNMPRPHYRAVGRNRLALVA